jgi:hypothetical protein
MGVFWKRLRKRGSEGGVKGRREEEKVCVKYIIIIIKK